MPRRPKFHVVVGNLKPLLDGLKIIERHHPEGDQCFISVHGNIFISDLAARVGEKEEFSPEGEAGQQLLRLGWRVYTDPTDQEVNEAGHPELAVWGIPIASDGPRQQYSEISLYRPGELAAKPTTLEVWDLINWHAPTHKIAKHLQARLVAGQVIIANKWMDAINAAKITPIPVQEFAMKRGQLWARIDNEWTQGYDLNKKVIDPEYEG